MRRQKRLEKSNVEWQIALERVKQETERMRLGVDLYKLKLAKQGKFDSSVSSGAQPCSFDVGAGLPLVLKFNERDPDTFFTLFERIAEKCEKLAGCRQNTVASVCPNR